MTCIQILNEHIEDAYESLMREPAEIKSGQRPLEVHIVIQENIK